MTLSAWGLFLHVLQRSLLSIYSTFITFLQQNGICFYELLSYEVFEFLSRLFMELLVLSAALLRANSQTQKLTNSQTRPYFLALGRLAPYLERRCVRLATPAVSSVPRTM